MFFKSTSLFSFDNHHDRDGERKINVTCVILWAIVTSCITNFYLLCSTNAGIDQSSHIENGKHSLKSTENN